MSSIFIDTYPRHKAMTCPSDRPIAWYSSAAVSWAEPPRSDRNEKQTYEEGDEKKTNLRICKTRSAAKRININYDIFTTVRTARSFSSAF
ncbi:hypothetical protein Trydic_g10134 [Trypoxylus dichotomus]